MFATLLTAIAKISSLRYMFCGEVDGRSPMAWESAIFIIRNRSITSLHCPACWWITGANDSYNSGNPVNYRLILICDLV